MKDSEQNVKPGWHFGSGQTLSLDLQVCGLCI